MALASAGVIAAGLFVVGPRAVFADGLALTVQADPTSGTVGADIPEFGATATLTGTLPTTSVSFTLYSDSGCHTPATPSVNGTVALDLQQRGTYSASYSQDWTPTAAGIYYWQASYTDTLNGSVSDCGGPNAQVVVGQAAAPIGTSVFDATTNSPWGGTETTGASAYDTSTVTGVSGVAPTGTISYTFWTNGACNGTGTAAGTTLSLGSKSSTEESLAAASYSFEATYSGDNNYSGSTSGCELFSVAAASSTTSTVVDDAVTQSPWSGNEKTGASAYDTASLGGLVSGFTPTGTVTYSFFTDSTCTVTATTTQMVTLNSDGTIPNSSTIADFASGSYSYQASYSGDSNYAASGPGACEPFSVEMSTATVDTLVDDAGLAAAWNGHEVIGTSAYDTSTVTGVSGVAPTGTISYTFWTNGACNGTGTAAGTTLSLGSKSSTEESLAAASYSFEATYSGDNNYSGSTSGCELFSVAAASSTTSTVVDDAVTQSPWSGNEKTGASAYDTASLGGLVSGFTPTGTVTYSFFTDSTCTVTATTTQMVTLNSDGTIPNSSTIADFASGSYSYQASYSGDSNYAASGPGACEPFSVEMSTATVDTTVDDAATNNPWSGTEKTGASAYDTSTVTGVAGIAPTGTISYTFWANGTCANTGTAAGSTLSLGTKSTTEGPLAAGSYSFQATYSGDGNYASSTSSCEPFTVGGGGTASVVTAVDDAATNNPWSGSEKAGASAYDTSTVTGVAGIAPTGTISYTFWANGTCANSGTAAGSTLSLGTKSTTEGPLAAGSYSFQATYSGDGNYASSTSSCEPFTVGGGGTASVVTAVDDAATNNPWSGSEKAGASAYDTSTVTGVAGIAPTGTISYTFWANGTCANSGTAAGSTLSLGTKSTTEGPLAAGSYSFQATYSGDGNYASSTSSCEPISVAKASPTITTVASPVTGTVGIAIKPAKDTATFAGTTSVAPTGSVAFALYSNSTCTTAVTGVSGTGQISTAGGVSSASYSATSWTPPAAGTYYWKASYAGDTNNNGFTTACGGTNEQIAVGKASPTITTSATPATGSAGVTIKPVKDAATFAGTTSVAPPTGSVNFTLYRTARARRRVTGVTGTGSISTTSGVSSASYSVNWTPSTAGTYYWKDSYPGDVNNNAFTTACGGAGEQIVIAKASPTMTTVPNPSTGTVGADIASLSDKATFSTTGAAAPTGSVTFTLYSNSACTTAVSGVSGSGVIASSSASYSANWKPTTAGTYYWVAVYPGDTNNSPATSTCGSEKVVISVPVSRITPGATTCAQFAGGFATAQSTIQYTLSGNKISAVTPTTFTYWMKVTSGGTYTITQSINGTSKKLLLVSSGTKGAVYDNATGSSCTTVSGAKITQNTTSGTVTVKFSSGTGPFYIGLNFSTSKLVGEAAPSPSTVPYLFGSSVAGSTSEIDLIA